MTDHKTGTREEWLAARLELLKAEKEPTRDIADRGGLTRWSSSPSGVRPVPPLRRGLVRGLSVQGARGRRVSLRGAFDRL